MSACPFPLRTQVESRAELRAPPGMFWDCPACGAMLPLVADGDGELEPHDCNGKPNEQAAAGGSCTFSLAQYNTVLLDRKKQG